MSPVFSRAAVRLSVQPRFRIFRWCLRSGLRLVSGLCDDGECFGEPRGQRESLEVSKVQLGTHLETYTGVKESENESIPVSWGTTRPVSSRRSSESDAECEARWALPTLDEVAVKAHPRARHFSVAEQARLLAPGKGPAQRHDGSDSTLVLESRWRLSVHGGVRTISRVFWKATKGEALEYVATMDPPNRGLETCRRYEI